MTVLDGKTNAASIVKFDMSIDQKTSDFILSSLFPDFIGAINIDYEKLNFTKRHTENSNGSTSCAKSEWLKLVIWDGGLSNDWDLDSNKKPHILEEPLMPMSSDSINWDLVSDGQNYESSTLMSELKLDKAIEQLKDDKMYSEVFERFEATPESDFSGFNIRKLDDWCEDSSTSHSPCPSPRNRKSLSSRQLAHGLLTPVSAEKKVKVIKEPSSVPCVRKRRYKRQRNPYIDDECRVSGFGYGSDEEVSDYEDDGFVVPDDYVDSGDESEVDKIDEIEESEPELEVGTSADKDSRNDASESQTAGPPRKRLKKKAQQPCSPCSSEFHNEIDEIESFTSLSSTSNAQNSSQSSDDTFFKPQIRRKRKFIIDDDDEESNGNNGENSFKPKQPVKKNQKQALFPPIDIPWIDHNTKSSKVARGQGQKSDRRRNSENLVKYILNVNTDIDILGDGSGTKVKVFERPIFTDSDSQDVYRDEGNIASIIDAVTDQTTTTDELCSKKIGPSSPIDDEIHKVLNTMSQELYIKSGLDAREYILENPGLLVPDDSRKVTQFTVNMLSKDAYAESNKMLIPVPDMPKYLIDDSIDTAGIISQLQIRKKSGISSLELDLQWYYDQKVSYDFAIQRQEYEVTDNNEALVSYIQTTNQSNRLILIQLHSLIFTTFTTELKNMKIVLVKMKIGMPRLESRQEFLQRIQTQ
ncbi:hypothetical protein BKA69DRAFT_290147 [Paraphysoderma sedebokerense]|nr:hypothetical protein BKA69DRAFT_290147 [Paraphysoderma sedebokerense]